MSSRFVLSEIHGAETVVARLRIYNGGRSEFTDLELGDIEELAQVAQGFVTKFNPEAPPKAPRRKQRTRR